MTIETIREALVWGLVINIILLLWWYLIIVIAHDWVYRVHTRWLKLSREQFDAVHYSGMALYKVLITFFLFVPFLVLWIVG